MAYYLSIRSKTTFISGVSLNQHRSHGPIFSMSSLLDMVILLGVNLKVLLNNNGKQGKMLVKCYHFTSKMFHQDGHGL